ncbi:IS481 family transposase, partial [Verminephrobacter eiseniae]|nr:IS481 family transposase [Verminephrobacter eiseniae]
WKKREVFVDRCHTAHRLQTVLTPAQETVVVHLRRTLLLPLDDLLAVTREFLCPDVSRSGLDRCLRRHGVGNLDALKPREPTVTHQAFKSYEPGYVHMDVKYLPQMRDESRRRYLFVAI